MATEDDFVNAMATNAGDEDLQLVFSDWLEEHGNTLRAELVRIQVELAKVAEEDRRYPKLLNQERALWLKWILSEMRARGFRFESPTYAGVSDSARRKKKHRKRKPSKKAEH